jgi:hypothetical protein
VFTSVIAYRDKKVVSVFVRFRAPFQYLLIVHQQEGFEGAVLALCFVALTAGV